MVEAFSNASLHVFYKALHAVSRFNLVDIANFCCPVSLYRVYYISDVFSTSNSSTIVENPYI